MKHIVGFSGGIDSQALARWLLNRYPANDVLLMNSDPGGNEAPQTYAFIDWYNENVHPVVRIHPIIADMWIGEDEPAKHGYDPSQPLTFELMIKIKGRPPSRKAQFCTEILKLIPQRRWIRANLINGDFERYIGLRRDESPARRNTPLRAWDDYFDCYVNYPLCDWTKQMCFDFVRAHGEQVNPLYTLGFSRVGCAPCINSSKADILNFERRLPEMIDKVRGLEERTGRTYFPPCVPGAATNKIDEIVAWAKTDHGGNQFNIFKVHGERPACESKFGLCE